MQKTTARNRSEWLFFDCMETLIAIDPVPTQRDYAAWAFTGSGTEHLWPDFDTFHGHHLQARRLLEQRLEPGREYDIRDRLRIICAELNKLDAHAGDDTIDRLHRTYRKRYVSHCRPAPHAREALALLHGRYRMAVVSNFIVAGGIEEMLTSFGLAPYFDFIVTSVGFGWRKPHASIYAHALGKADAAPERTVFIGDDIRNDCRIPAQLGMRTLHYDPAGAGACPDRFTSFAHLPPLLGAC